MTELADSFRDSDERFQAEEEPVSFSEKVIWAIARGILATWVLYGVMALAGWVAIARLPAGKVFVLNPRGWGLVSDLAWWILIISLCSVIYSLPALVVRGHIGCLVRVCTVLIFVIVVTKFQAESCIAVVQQPDRFVFVRRVPFPYRYVANEDAGEMKVYRTRVTRTVELRAGPGDYIRCSAVWRIDAETTQVLDSLIGALRAASR